MNGMTDTERRRVLQDPALTDDEREQLFEQAAVQGEGRDPNPRGA
jgi:hypothetical protein